jgi:hypothetical protein
MAGIAVAALITGAAGAAGVARAPHMATSTTGTIYACYSNTTKTLFQTTKTRGCARGFTELSWNTRGPKGATGATGAVGPVGPRGPAGPAGSSGVLIDAGVVEAYSAGGTDHCGVFYAVGPDAGTIAGIGIPLGNTEFYCTIAGFSSTPVLVSLVNQIPVGANSEPDSVLTETAANGTGCPVSTLTVHGCIVFTFEDSVVQGPGGNYFWEAMETAPTAAG